MSTPSVKELLAQIAALQEQVAAARKIEIADAVSKIHALIQEHGLTVEDIFPSSAKIAKSGVKSGKALPIYRDPETGTTWSGRGLTPKWLQNKNRADYLIKKD